jgi:hypothetical protein
MPWKRAPKLRHRPTLVGADFSIVSALADFVKLSILYAFIACKEDDTAHEPSSFSERFPFAV